jgi:DnaJ-class molecular chaperone
MTDCRACSGTGIDWEAEFDRPCLICGGYGTQEAADEYDDDD